MADEDKGESFGELRSDVRHITTVVHDIRVDLRGTNQRLDAQRDELTREASNVRRELTQRLDTLVASTTEDRKELVAGMNSQFGACMAAVAELRKEFTVRFDALEGRVSTLEIAVAELRKEVFVLRDELRVEIGKVRDELRMELRAEIGKVRDELRGEITKLRDQVHSTTVKGILFIFAQSATLLGVMAHGFKWI